MKAILEFNLPEDASAHQTALDGWKWKTVLETLDQQWKRREDIGPARRLLQEAVDEAGLELFG